MKRTFLLLLALLLPAAAAAGTPHWNGEQVRQLLGRLQSSGSEGLEPAAREAGKVRAALAQHDSGLVDQAATAAAVRLLKAHRTGCCQDEARSEEHTSELQSLMRTAYHVFCLKNK